MVADPIPEQPSGSSAAVTEADRLAEEERRLSEREAHVEGHEKAQVYYSLVKLQIQTPKLYIWGMTLPILSYIPPDLLCKVCGSMSES